MKINTPKDLSAVIRDSRKSKGWTQANLAKRIGVYQRDISNYETKSEKVSVEIDDVGRMIKDIQKTWFDAAHQ